MSAKRKIIIGLAAATIGLGAPAAGAATTGHDIGSGLLNFSDNNAGPGQACNNEVPVNAVGGQVPVDDIAGTLGIGSHGNSSMVDNSCTQGDYQAD